jgi:hypothetical protein
VLSVPLADRYAGRPMPSRSSRKERRAGPPAARSDRRAVAGGIEPAESGGRGRSSWRGAGSTVDRRQFLAGATAGLGGLAVAIGLGGCGTGTPTAKGTIPARAKKPVEPPAVSQITLDGGNTVPSARWLVEENARPGTNDWVVTGIQSPHELEGFASQVSAVAGDEVQLFVNSTSAKTVLVQAYRMGYYQGLAGRLISTTDTVPVQRQRAPVFTPGVNTVSCPWNPTLSVKVDATWPPGNYLLKLVGDAGQQQYIPLTVRDDTSTAAFVIQNSVSTWQAYNLWGDYSLYYGATASGGSDFAHRSRVVSYDRPYPQTWAQGAADFFGNEFPLLYHLESLGIDLTYWTDIDLHVRPELLAKHQCLFSLGHDEYWSTPMRNGAATALAQGTNLAFLGANACYRQIRLESSSVGPNRLQVCYKDAAEDPMTHQSPELTTVNWEQSPVNQPESTLIGSMYQSVGSNDGLVITDPTSWFFNGCGFNQGTVLANVVQGEYDRYVPHFPGPTNVDVLAHSPVSKQGNWSDITYYTVAGGGGVLSSGMASFIFKLSNTTEFPWNIVPKALPGITEPLLRAMENLYSVFGNGAASATPSAGNWAAIYQGNSAKVPSAAGTTTA